MTGDERDGWLLIGAMFIVAAVLAFLMDALT